MTGQIYDPSFCLFSVKQRIELIEAMDYLPALGEVDLQTPAVEFSYLEFWGLRCNELPPEPYNIFFGPKIGQFLAALGGTLVLYHNESFIHKT